MLKFFMLLLLAAPLNSMAQLRPEAEIGFYGNSQHRIALARFTSLDTRLNFSPTLGLSVQLPVSRFSGFYTALGWSMLRQRLKLAVHNEAAFRQSLNYLEFTLATYVPVEKDLHVFFGPKLYYLVHAKLTEENAVKSSQSNRSDFKGSFLSFAAVVRKDFKYGLGVTVEFNLQVPGTEINKLGSANFQDYENMNISDFRIGLYKRLSTRPYFKKRPLVPGGIN